jgi:hypothetical protein
MCSFTELLSADFAVPLASDCAGGVAAVAAWAWAARIPIVAAPIRISVATLVRRQNPFVPWLMLDMGSSSGRLDACRPRRAQRAALASLPTQ